MRSFSTQKSKNQALFDSKGVVRSYSREKELKRPEQTIFELLRDELHAMKMLDIGIGAGRTTFYFGPLVKEYVGIDYSPRMIELCKKRFNTHGRWHRFEVCDARNLAVFQNQAFDFIMFSFNGIDFINHDDRLKCLDEIHRVAKKGAQFCFSSHNLNCAERLLSFHRPEKLLHLPLEPFYYVLLRLTNKLSPAEILKRDFAIINDGAHNFKLSTYYVRPKEQLRQLDNAGFDNVRLYGCSDGREIGTSVDSLNSIHDLWIYYLCTA